MKTTHNGLYETIDKEIHMLAHSAEIHELNVALNVISEYCQSHECNSDCALFIDYDVTTGTKKTCGLHKVLSIKKNSEDEMSL